MLHLRCCDVLDTCEVSSVFRSDVSLHACAKACASTHPVSSTLRTESCRVTHPSLRGKVLGLYHARYGLDTVEDRRTIHHDDAQRMHAFDRYAYECTLT